MAARTRSAYADLLRNRTWRLLWGGQAISSFGDAFFDLAMSWLVFVQTGSALQSAGVYATTGLANLILGPLGGAFADRWDRRRTMVAADLLRAAIVGGVAVAAGSGHLSSWLVYAAAFCLNGLARLFSPARFSVVPDIVARSELVASGGLFSAAANAARFVGNALAGVLITAAGSVAAVLVDAVSFVASAVAVTLARIPPRRDPQGVHGPFLRELAAGWRIIMDVPALRAVLWIGVLANAGSFVGGLLPALVRLRLHGTAAAFGAIESVSVVGAVLGGAGVAWAERRLGLRGVLMAAMACNAAAYAIFAVSTSVALTAGAAAFDAMVTPLTSVPMTAILQAASPPDRLGRVGGTFSPVAGAVAPFAVLLGGAAADRFGLVPVYLVSALWALGLVVVVWRSAALRAVRLESH